MLYFFMQLLTTIFCRLELVKELKIDLHDEVKYISDVIRQFTKNYQVWYASLFMYVIMVVFFILMLIYKIVGNIVKTLLKY